MRTGHSDPFCASLKAERDSGKAGPRSPTGGGKRPLARSVSGRKSGGDWRRAPKRSSAPAPPLAGRAQAIRAAQARPPPPRPLASPRGPARPFPPRRRARTHAQARAHASPGRPSLPLSLPPPPGRDIAAAAPLASVLHPAAGHLRRARTPSRSWGGRGGGVGVGRGLPRLRAPRLFP